MIDPGWALNPSTWLLIGAVCLLLEIALRWLFFLGFGISGAVIAVLVWQFSDRLTVLGDPMPITGAAFGVVGLVLFGVLRMIFRRRRSPVPKGSVEG